MFNISHDNAVVACVITMFSLVFLSIVGILRFNNFNYTIRYEEKQITRASRT